MNVAESFEPSAGNLLGKAEIYDNMHYEMDITIYEFGDMWTGILNCINGDDEYPLITMTSRGFYVQMEGLFGSMSSGEPLTVGESYHLEVDFTQNSCTMKQDGVFAYHELTGYTTGITARCWAWSRSTTTPVEPANVSISNLLITTSGMPSSFLI